MAMTLRPTTGVPTVLRALRFTTIRMEGRPECAALAAELKALRAELEAAAEAAAELEDRSAAATAEIMAMDEAEDAAVADLARHLRAAVGGDVRDPRWAGLFVRPPSELTAPRAGEVQAAHVRHILDRLHSDPAYAELGAQAAALLAAREAVAAAEAARDSLQPGLYAAQHRRRLAKDEAIRAHNRLRPQLQLLYPSAARVRSFFLDDRRSGAEVDEVDEG
jgi:hypothetical protein